MTTPAPITSEMSVPEIVAQHPETQAVFATYGLHISGYKALVYENLVATSRVHQLNLDNLIQDLNAAISS